MWAPIPAGVVPCFPLFLAAAAASRCALPNYCPSDSELEAAVRGSTEATIEAMLDAANAANPDAMTSMHAPRIFGISDVYCGDYVSDAPRSITCRLTVRYSSSRSYRVVRVSRDGEGWTIHDQLGVSRPVGRRR